MFERPANCVEAHPVRHPLSRYDWERLPADPDPAVDLGYDVVDWDCFEAESAGGNSIMFLPRDPELLRDEAFVVAHERAVCDLAFFA